MMTAMRWLERHYKEDFFLYVDTWDPHEPWDAPEYYTERYWPSYDGEVIQPVYGRWQDDPEFTEQRVKKAHASYCGEIAMVDTWIGHLLGQVENMGLMEKTAIIFTSDHGFYFGEHGGLFGKMTYDKRPDGRLYRFGDDGAYWAHSPLYEELVRIPLLIYLPGLEPRVVLGTHVGGRCDAHRAGYARAGYARYRGRKLAPAQDARQLHAGPRIRHHHHTLCQHR